MKLTQNSLATTIAWVSTCLLAAGISTLFNESTRQLWMGWGCFGLAAAVGLDAAARFRERMHAEDLKRIAAIRFDRELHVAAEEKQANAAIREAVRCILGADAGKLARSESRRGQERVACNLDVEVVLEQSPTHNGGKGRKNAQVAQITNLSDTGFELVLREPIRPQRVTMIAAAPNGERFTMLGEVLWCSPATDIPIVAGGRFLNAVAKSAT